jgi:hypothetical protein
MFFFTYVINFYIVNLKGRVPINFHNFQPSTMISIYLSTPTNIANVKIISFIYLFSVKLILNK